jgi:branched-chain amino acid transport system permease protein
MHVTFDLILQQLVTGFALGAIYVLVAVGLSLIFGMLTVVNFAHGAFFMMGAFVGIWTLGRTGSFVFACLAAMVFAAAFGAISERFLIRPLYGRGYDYPLLLTFGIAYVLVDTARMVFGRAGLPVELPEMLQGGVELRFGYFPLYRLVLIGVTILLLGLLWLAIERTRWGLIIRAGSRDPMILRVLGINITAVWLAVFALGSALAALAGVLAAPLQGVTPEMGDSALVTAFVVTVVGGMGSLIGAVVAGFALGAVSSITSLFAPEFSELVLFICMGVTLLIRPRGLFGVKGVLG